ncbi:MAG: hypothetical protein GPJ29_22915 [Microcystis aeruginosa BK11-02]|jgi:hypothetical protein|nr:hypothetical protein [Microcystis aeruginosa BK11-02]NCS79254.1 hypothetical protein [Microcystis aeruginosa K13-07]
MTAKEQLLQEIEQAPESLVQSCLELIRSHKTPAPSPQNNQAIWEIADEIIATIPEESFDKVPTDAAANLDYYLYGHSPQE